MKLFFPFAFLLSLVFAVSCVRFPCKYIPDSSTAYTNHVPTNQTTVIRHVYIDPSFSSNTRNQIEDGLKEWNIVLNGYEKFVVAKGDLPAYENMSPFDFVIVNITAKEAEEMLMPDGVLGWVDDLGDPVIHLIEYRMVDQNIKILLMHELGHSLGLPHLQVRGTLMFPYYANAPCATETDVRMLATVHRGAYDLSHLNWCSYLPN